MNDHPSFYSQAEKNSWFFVERKEKQIGSTLWSTRFAETSKYQLLPILVRTDKSKWSFRRNYKTARLWPFYLHTDSTSSNDRSLCGRKRFEKLVNL